MRLSYLFWRCLSIPYTHAALGADYALERVGHTLYLYLEASDGREDWGHNLDFPITAYRRQGKTVFRAHRGFLAVWRALEAELGPTLCDPALTALTIVGYSHGAALAVLAHEYVWYHRPELRPRLTGIGFGCPRVIFGTAAARLAARWERFTVVRNIDDIVTHLPPAVFGYRHVGQMLEIGARGRYARIDAHRPENILRELKRLE